MKRHEKEFGQYYEDWKKYDNPWVLWEFNHYNDIGHQWDGFYPMTYNMICFFGQQGYEFRRKPETIKIGDWELPKPLTGEPERNDTVWILHPLYPNGYAEIGYHEGIHEAAFLARTLFAEEDHAKIWVAWWRSEVIGRCE